MKRFTTLFLSLMLVFGLAACGNDRQGGGRAEPSPKPANEAASDPENQEDAANEAATEPEVPGNAATETSEDAATEPAGNPENIEGKTLVVYYSATGNTEEAAGYIAAATNADLFVLEPVEPYSREDLDWTDDSSRVVYEHDNPDARAVELKESTAPDWASYDTVFIGYPIWWGIAAWPVDGFIAANDFTGKTVIPFCTSASSGLGESGELLAEAAGTGNWLEGVRFSSSVSEADVQAWVESLGL